ncbi:MAG TPA: prepilin-type N-terminal cleavage/methylation domain-containing protein [Verrucomicrobiae bacterium]|jgi:general secretion pathway protein G|nr:prepilin-type N-terminal cleavage/methylation domain-containing protein [Verrucomicrobiae bacterium]
MNKIMGRLKENGVARRKRATRLSSGGFTLIELMIVIAIILILLGLAAGRYDMTIQRSREAVLKHDLQVLREAIDNFTLDKQAAPQSLEDLHQAGYLREVPVDPMTQATDWDPVFDNVVLSPDQVITGMVDVHSHSPLNSRFDGTAYNTW